MENLNKDITAAFNDIELKFSILTNIKIVNFLTFKEPLIYEKHHRTPCTSPSQVSQNFQQFLFK